MSEELDMLRALYRSMKDGADELLYDPCDCGCPWQRSPKNRKALEIIAIIKELNSLMSPYGETGSTRQT